MKERWTALAYTLCLCISLVSPAAATGGCTDALNGARCEAAVNEVTGRGYMTGVSEGQSAPTANVTRATIMTILWWVEGSPVPTAIVSFGNVSSEAWYAQPVAQARKNGTADGDSRGNFKLDQPVTRQELVALFVRYDRYQGMPLAEGSLNLYSDINMTGVWAVEGMRHAVGIDWLDGDSGRLLPGGVATHAQLVVILQRLITQAMG